MKNLLLLAFSCAILATACKQSGGQSGANKEKKSGNDKGSFKNTDLYDLADPYVIKLPLELDEISGITYYPKDSSVFAIVDEDGLLFKIPVMHPNDIKHWSFYKPRDFEDVVLLDSIFYVLISSGDIVKIRFKNDEVISEKFDLSSVKKSVNEFESMYLMPDSSGLVIVCKECEEDNKRQVTSFEYAFDSSKHLKQSDSLPPGLRMYKVLQVDSIARALGEEKLNLRASAANINPVNGDLYIISSIQKALVILDKDGNFKEAYKLDPKIYTQPEGLCFTPAGDLIISSELGDGPYAKLLIMKNKKKVTYKLEP